MQVFHVSVGFHRTHIDIHAGVLEEALNGLDLFDLGVESGAHRHQVEQDLVRTVQDSCERRPAQIFTSSFLSFGFGDGRRFGKESDPVLDASSI